MQLKMSFSVGQGDGELMHTLSNKVTLKPGRSKSEKGLSTDGMKVGLQTSCVYHLQTKSGLYRGSPHWCN